MLFPGVKIAGLRWYVAGMLFLAAILNYIDRQTLSILAPTIQEDLGLGEAEYAGVVNAFLVAYTVSTLLSGRIVDRLGARLGMALFVAWWSLANMLTGLAYSAASLGSFRALLGIGEAGNWTGSPKAVSEWFPPKERGLAVGLYTLGATVGATLAPIIVLAVGSRYGWQSAFVVTGALGALWVVPWAWLYRHPREHPRITARERGLIESIPEGAEPGDRERGGWAQVAGRRDVWLLMGARMLTDPVWYFYQFWLAKYLYSARGLSQDELGVTWVVYLAADLGSVSGGYASGRLVRRGYSASASRLAVMGICACLVPLSPLVAQAGTVRWALAVAAVVVFAHLAWMINISTLVVDVMPASLTATAFGIVAAGSALGGIVMNGLVAWLVTHYSYTYWFYLMMLPHPIAWLCLRWFLPREPMRATTVD